MYANVVHHNYSQDACYRFTSTVSWNPQLFSLAAVLCHWSMLGGEHLAETQMKWACCALQGIWHVRAWVIPVATFQCPCPALQSSTFI